MSCPVCVDVPEEISALRTNRFCGDCGLESRDGDKFCRQCGLRFDTPQRSSAPDRFCRQCGSRQNGTSQNTTERQEQKSFWIPMRGGKAREAHLILIALMWVLTAASWVSLLALEPMLGIVLDLIAVLFALVLSFLPSWTDRINGWSKIGIEVASFTYKLWHP